MMIRVKEENYDLDEYINVSQIYMQLGYPKCKQVWFWIRSNPEYKHLYIVGTSRKNSYLHKSVINEYIAFATATKKIHCKQKKMLIDSVVVGGNPIIPIEKVKYKQVMDDWIFDFLKKYTVLKITHLEGCHFYER